MINTNDMAMVNNGLLILESLSLELPPKERDSLLTVVVGSTDMRSPLAAAAEPRGEPEPLDVRAHAGDELSDVRAHGDQRQVRALPRRSRLSLSRA